MSGVVYDYKALPSKLHRFFISYRTAKGRYIEENFDTDAEAGARQRALRSQGIKDAVVWTRERAVKQNRLRDIVVDSKRGRHGV